MKRYPLSAALALVATTSWQALAESPARASSKLEEVVVTSSRVPMPLRQIGTSVSVITDEQIREYGFNALYDVLRTQPGIGVSNQGGAGSVTALRIRGEESFRTRFYIDGIDISDTSSPQTMPRVEQLLSSGVERVEILRGPQGLMYGADAGGVLNISTAAPREGFASEISAKGGRYDSEQYAVNLAGGNDSVDFSLSGANFSTDGFNATTTDTVLKDDDGYDNTTAHGRLGWNVTEDLRLSLVGRSTDSNHDYDGCYNNDFLPSDDCEDEFKQQAWRTAANYRTGKLQHELFYTDSSIDRDFYSEGDFSFKLDGGLERAGYLGSFEGSDELRLVYGVDLLEESSDDGYIDTNRDQQGYYAEYQGGFSDRVFVTAGTRYDDNDDFGSHTSYRLSGAYLIPVDGGEFKLRATYGTGFRAPSLFEVATNASPFTGPPAQGYQLSEEESDGYDLGASWASDGGLFVEAVYFDQTISDEIFYDFDSFGYLQKNGDTESKGVELFAEWPVLASLSMTGNYTYTDSQDINGDPRPRRPEHMANVGLRWSTLSDRVVLGLNARLSRDAVEFDGSNIDDFEVFDLNASFRLLDNLEVYGRVENFTDEDYEQVPTYNTSGAAGHLGLRYMFQG